MARTTKNSRVKSMLLYFFIALLLLYISSYCILSRTAMKTMKAYNCENMFYLLPCDLMDISRSNTLYRYEYRMRSLYWPLIVVDANIFGKDLTSIPHIIPPDVAPEVSPAPETPDSEPDSGENGLKSGAEYDTQPGK